MHGIVKIWRVSRGDNMQETITKQNEGPREFAFGFTPGFIGLAVAAGFALIVFSTFLDFTPVCQRSWRTGGVGLPVMLSCLAGVILALRKNYFTSFFIGIFAAFFLTHEIVVIYDNRAVELGLELKPDGWFRSVIQVYLDALQPGYGAFWGFIGSTLASLVPLVGMALEVRQKNLAAAEASVMQAQSEDSTDDVADEDFDSEEGSDSDEDDPYQSEDEYSDSEDDDIEKER